MTVQTKPIKLNLPQLICSLAIQRIKILEHGRGQGKSTILALDIKNLVEGMPRCVFPILASSYTDAWTKTLPSTLDGLEMFGYYENIHYSIGKPLKGADKPYKSPRDWKNVIHFFTGAAAILLSQEKSGDGRGGNFDGGIVDECALIKEEFLANNFLLSIRGSRKEIFESSPYFRKVTMASTTPVTAEGRWMFKYEQRAKLNPKEFFYSIASSRSNAHNLPKGWFDDLKETLPELIYDAEIEGIRMNSVQNGFYPKLNIAKNHGYMSSNNSYLETLNIADLRKVNSCMMDEDVDRYAPLIISIDWGASINCMVIMQYQMPFFRFLKSIYVMSPKILDDLANDFCDYYFPHPTKEVIMHYDRTGDDKQANSRYTKAEQFANILIKRGWDVTLVSHGEREAPHDMKFELMNMLHSENNPNAPRLRYNKVNCKALIVSLENAGAIEENGKIGKDKRPEKNKKIDQSTTTHISDAHDIPLWRMFKHLIERNNNLVLGPMFR